MDPKTFRLTLEDIIALNASEGPNTNVFEPKYAARAQAQELEAAVTKTYRDRKSVLAIRQLCRCLIFIGTTMMEVEEVDDGFTVLRKAHALVRYLIRSSGTDEDAMPALSTLEPTAEADVLGASGASAPPPHPSESFDFEGVVEYVRVYNALGMYYSSTNNQDASRALQLAEAAYTTWDAWFMQQPYACAIEAVPLGDDGRLAADHSDASHATAAVPGGEADSRDPTPSPMSPMTPHAAQVWRYEMDTAFCTTLFFLAQVHASLGHQRLASEYCHRTMHQQLLCRQEFSKKTWATNALRLSAYYCSCHAYGRALHCLEASRHMMPMENPDDETAGALAWGYGHYHLYRLQHYGLDKDQEPPAAATSVDDIFWVDFPGVPAAATQPAITTFEEARETFKEGMRYMNEALTFYPFETSCTHHIELKQDMVKLYASLITFESSRSRRIAMVQRQIALLESFPDQLSFNAYPIVIRQLLYDLGMLCESEAEMRAAQRKMPFAGEVPLKDRAYNALVDKTLQYYQRFCETWKTPSTDRIPDVLDEDSRLPYFRVLMRRAHVQLTYAFKTAKEEYDSLGVACEQFKSAIHFFEQNPLEDAQQQQGMEQEVSLAKQMVELLPRKQVELYRAFQRGLAH